MAKRMVTHCVCAGVATAFHGYLADIFEAFIAAKKTWRPAAHHHPLACKAAARSWRRHRAAWYFPSSPPVARLA